MKTGRWDPNGIEIHNRMRREIKEEAVKELMESIQEIGLQEPPTIRIRVDDEGFQEAILVAGAHRVEACKRLGLKFIDCVEFQGSEIDARLWEIDENLRRAELTELEWSEHVAEWKRLVEQKDAERVSGHNVQKLSTRGRVGEGRPESGTAKAARQLPIPGETEDARRKAVERAVKIANTTPEAKAAAQEVGLDDSKVVLMAIANAPPDKQVAKVREIAAAKEAREKKKQEKRQGADKNHPKKKRGAGSLSVVAPSEAHMFAEWLMERMEPKEKPLVISWLEGCKPKDVIAAMRQKAA